MKQRYTPTTRKKSAICSKCSNPGFRFRGERWLCVTHNRFDTMRTCAKSKGKYVPTHGELERLAGRLIANGMKCEACGCKMNWHSEASRKKTVSLQHDASGAVRLICMSCNSRHGNLLGDSLYSLPKDHWRCPKCEIVKPLSEFYKNRVGSCCKMCRKKLNAEMWKRFGKQWAANSKRKKRANHPMRSV